jgi:hypothetical protein
LPEIAPATGQRFAYSLHGLILDSALELPQLLATKTGPADVTIAFGKVDLLPPDRASRFRNWSARPDEMVITAIGSAHFQVTGGNRIVIDRLPTATQADLISFTLGSAMSALLQQRGLLPLHASTVVTSKGALLVTGRSGAGKSTLVAELVRMGLPLLADDVTAIGSGSADRPLAMPGLPALRLWRDAFERLGETPELRRQVREDVDKYYLPILERCTAAQPICAIVRLATKAEGPLDLAELERAEQVRWLSHHVHRKHFLPGMGLQQFAFESAVRIARHAPMLQVTRPHRGVEPAEIAQSVLDWLEARPLRRAAGS